MLSWKIKPFGDTYYLFENGTNSGSINCNFDGSIVLAHLNGNQYEFRTSGFINQITIITDKINLKQMGIIRYNEFKREADIILSNSKTYKWKSNLWINVDWIVSDFNGEIIKYKGKLTDGTIDLTNCDDLLTLTGLFAGYHFTMMQYLTFIVIFIPIWIILFS